MSAPATQPSRSSLLEGAQPPTHAGGALGFGEPAFEPPAQEPDDAEPSPLRAFTRRRILTTLLLLAVLAGLILLPPLLNVGRYKRQIASSIGQSLGRPVHMDDVALNLFPLPSFTLKRFVVAEDPAFGEEPVLRADEVRATLRIGSLWRRRLEFSRIALSEPSVNLVHLPDGRWNLQSILLQASRMPAAPTAQRGSGDTPRFPYIEASNARVNLKLGAEKTPISLTEADFALWLPEPQQWRLRLKAHPARTDTAATDTGLLRVDATLGRAETLEAVPIAGEADWTAVPLGALSWITMGRDAGMRGLFNLHAAVHGTLGNNLLSTRLALSQVHRADFVPARMLEAEVTCQARAQHAFQSVAPLHCQWPGPSAGSGLDLALTVPDTSHPGSATGSIKLRGVPLAGALELLRMASNRVAPELEASGVVAADLPCCAAGGAPQPSPTGANVQVAQATLGIKTQTPFLDADLSGAYADQRLSLAPMPLALGAATPATLLVELNPVGYTMQLSGPVLRGRLLQLAAALPQFGDGLEAALPPVGPADAASAEPMQVHLSSARTWFGGQTWSAIAAQRPPAARSRPRSRRRQ